MVEKQIYYVGFVCKHLIFSVLQDFTAIFLPKTWSITTLNKQLLYQIYNNVNLLSQLPEHESTFLSSYEN